jgi:hypothetical protein
LLAVGALDTWVSQLQEQNMAEWGRTLIVLSAVLVAIAWRQEPGPGD